MIDCTDEKFTQIVKNSFSRAEIARKIKIPYNGRYNKIIMTRINKLNLDYSHFQPNSSYLYKKPRVIKECPVCYKKFETISGERGNVVCSRSCSNTMFRSGENHPNWKHPDERISRDKIYRSICFEHYPYKCVLCDWDLLVDVHHIDSNHKNEDPKNLIPLCPNHHSLLRTDKYKQEINEKIKEIVKQKFNL